MPHREPIPEICTATRKRPRPISAWLLAACVAIIAMQLYGYFTRKRLAH
jgi:hypothetical protein